MGGRIDVEGGGQRREEAAAARVDGPFMGGLRPEHDLPDRAGHLFGLRQVADRRVARPGRSASVQVGCASEGGKQRGLTRAIAAHDPDPVARRHAKRHLVEQHPPPVGLHCGLEVHDVHARAPHSTTLAPGTGPDTWTTARQTPAPVTETASSRAASALLARKAQVGPEPETIAPSAPCSLPAWSARRSSGCSDSAAGWRSLVRSGPTAAGSPERSAAIKRVLSWGSGAATGCAAFVRLGALRRAPAPTTS